MRTFDLFVTDEDFDKDETEIGRVSNWRGGPDPLFDYDDDWSIRVKGSDETQTTAILDALKRALRGRTAGVLVRFVSAKENETYEDDEHIMYRYHTVTYVGDEFFEVDQPVQFEDGDNWRCMLAHEHEPTLRLTTRFQHVTKAELLAYALVGLSSLSHYVPEGREMAPMIDFVGLEIKELPGRTLSTNRFMQNMFAVLPTHASGYHPVSWLDGKDAMIFVPPGTMQVQYDQPVFAVNTITPRLFDRKGNPVVAARFHMWLRLTTLDQ